MSLAKSTVKPTARREALVTLSLLAVAVAAFAAVQILANRFHAWQANLGRQIYQRGQAEMRSAAPDLAMDDFRSALSLSRDNFEYAFNLAQSLAAAGRVDEAHSYLLNLWERQPQNGAINLQLARMAARLGKTDQVLRYYHNAIYGIWDENPDQNRRAARSELIEFLLQQNSRTQADSELIAMQAGLPPDPQEHVRAGGLFMRTQDYENALREFRQALQLDRRDVQAAAGAGQAAFALGWYRTAQRYLEIAAANSSDGGSRKMLEKTGLILEADPFRSGLSRALRVRRVRLAIDAATYRLQSCMEAHPENAGPDGSAAPLQELHERWLKLKPRVRGAALASDPDLWEEAMEFVFDVEEETQDVCGAPVGFDHALLLIGRHRRGAEQ